MQPTDIVILSNGPGEVATWVRPVVQQLPQILNQEISFRISVILSPCPHSTGKETAIALSYPEVDRVLPPEAFFEFLLWGKIPENWQWHSRGLVLFLGGDQFYTVIISKRLGYSSLIYAEWDARWYRFVNRFAAANQQVIEKVHQAYQHKFSVVGDLMADAASGIEPHTSNNTDSPLIGLLVGSKPAKLFQGLPLCMAIAEKVQQHLTAECGDRQALPLQGREPVTQAQFVIPVAPTLDLVTLSNYANRQHNPLISALGNVDGTLMTDNETQLSYLITSGGTKIQLLTEFPAYETLASCQLCLTTVGANTAELTTLRVPMIVMLPTQQLDAMRSWDGIPGILANLPGLGAVFAKLINWLIIRQNRLFAWPNIWAKQEIVPELVGKLEPKMVADLVLDYLAHPQKLQVMREHLTAVGRKTGAAKQIADIINQEITKT
ncbi:MAG: lipid-A-disaccharide synthase [Cyanobacteria bacterium P01_A01_bin.83]